ncbi:SDR family oxidoreductase [Lolliginicoccus levis]|uniref:SDR family oxidoreductase n=1 Tax=Lolliginicoccus levis TaxID=2919542 RepID=UPI00241F44BF|nr:NAD(P)H-binding protein [Lolliginicoccus levis]
MILVTGGTGTLGAHVVDQLVARGHAVRALSRKAQPERAGGAEWALGDLATGVGIEAAVTGVDTIIHCASATAKQGTSDAKQATCLIEAARKSGTPRLIYISIVGIDEVPMPYYKRKVLVERLIEGSRLPHTILRATQFHDLPTMLFRAQKRLPVVVVPGARIQPIEAREVAARLVELAEDPVDGRAEDMGGPEETTIEQLAEQYFAARASDSGAGQARRKKIIVVPVPGRIGAAINEGKLLCPANAVGQGTYADYLAR